MVSRRIMKPYKDNTTNSTIIKCKPIFIENIRPGYASKQQKASHNWTGLLLLN